MANTTYIARNGSLEAFTDAEIRIYNMHKDAAEVFMSEHASDLYPEYVERIVAYGQDYYYDGGLYVDDDGEVHVACDLAALHELTTDDMDRLELHGQTYMGELECYREIGTSSQREYARDLVNMDTRAETIRICREGRAKSLQAHINRRVDTRGEHVAANIKEAARKRTERAAKKARAAERKARRAK